MIVKALIELGYASCKWRVRNEEIYENLYWLDENTECPTEEEIQSKIQELEAAEPMRLLREERNRRIAETDWWVLPDRTASQEQKDYRQALRDLPSTASPQLDEKGQLINVTWPTKPEIAG